MPKVICAECGTKTDYDDSTIFNDGNEYYVCDSCMESRTDLDLECIDESKKGILADTAPCYGCGGDFPISEMEEYVGMDNPSETLYICTSCLGED